MALLERAVALRFARQSGASSRRTQRRDPAGATPRHESAGGVRAGRSPTRGLRSDPLPGARGSDSVKGTSIRGSRRPSRGCGGSGSRPIRPSSRGRLQPRASRRTGDPGARETAKRRGSSFASPLLSCSRPTPRAPARRRGSPPSPRGTCWTVSTVRHARGSNARRVCPRVVSCCRSRKAARRPREARVRSPIRNIDPGGRGLARIRS